ncbi:MAG TPA: LiaF domain-containing protein [Acidimicrobiales bacterium]
MSGPRYRHHMGGPDADQTTASRPTGLDRRLFGFLLIAFGVLWFLEGSGLLGLSVESLLSIFLIALGAGLLLTARQGGRARLPIILGAVTILVLIGNSPSLHLPSMGSGFGSQRFQPLTAADVRSQYRGGVGEFTLDLTQLHGADLNRTVEINVGVGHVRVLVPPETDVNVQANFGVGQLRVCGRHVADGFGVNDSFDNNLVGEHPHLHLLLHGGVGDARVIGCVTNP